MNHGCVDRDREARERQYRGGTCHVRELRPEIPDTKSSQRCSIVAAQLTLDTEERNAFTCDERFEQLKINRPVAIIGMARMAGPSQGNALSRQRLDYRPPFCKRRFACVQVGAAGGDGRKLGL